MTPAPLPHNTMYVRSFGTSDIRLAKTKFIYLLGEEAIDAARASRGSVAIMVAYQIALARLKGEDQCN